MTNIAKGGSRDKREMKFRNRAMPSRILYSTFYKYRKEQKQKQAGNEVLRFDYAEPHPIFYKYNKEQKQKQINPFVFLSGKPRYTTLRKKQDSPADYSRLSTPQSNLFRSVSPKLWL